MFAVRVAVVVVAIVVVAVEMLLLVRQIAVISPHYTTTTSVQFLTFHPISVAVVVVDALVVVEEIE